MKNILLFTGLILISFSCSNDNTDCRLERLELIARYDTYINNPANNATAKAALIKERDDKLRLLDC